MYNAIVVGTNGSETAAKAVAHAAALAQANDATLHIVASLPPRAVSAGAAAGVIIDSREDVASILAEAAKAVQQDGLLVQTHALQLEPAQAIVDVATQIDADLVVVGDKGMRGAKRFVLGSVPNSVAHSAPCAVLIVKTT